MKKVHFKNILIGFAFSPNLKANVFEATRLANFFDGNLFFLHVGEKTVAKEKTFSEILKDSPVNPKQINVLWEEGQPDKTIIAQCKLHKIDL